MLHAECVEVKNGGYYVKGERVSLASIVVEMRRGASAEEIRESFSILTLDEVRGAMAFAAANPEEVERDLERLDRLWRELEAEATLKGIAMRPILEARIAAARERAALDQTA